MSVKSGQKAVLVLTLDAKSAAKLASTVASVAKLDFLLLTLPLLEGSASSASLRLRLPIIGILQWSKICSSHAFVILISPYQKIIKAWRACHAKKVPRPTRAMPLQLFLVLLIRILSMTKYFFSSYCLSHFSS